MAQVKIFGLKKHLDNVKRDLSYTIHQCVVASLSFPKEKKYHRFISFEQDDIEICIIESPVSNWGFRGMPGDEIKLNYKVNV